MEMIAKSIPHRRYAEIRLETVIFQSKITPRW